MRFVIFSHSAVSDWNHGNAHFLRGFCTELILRGHDVQIFEPADGWSRVNLVRQSGEGAGEIGDGFQRSAKAGRQDRRRAERLDRVESGVDGRGETGRA